MLTQEQFIRNFNVMADGEVDFFIGAGASIASGIPTGGDLIWEFKRNIYCSECGISVENIKMWPCLQLEQCCKNISIKKAHALYSMRLKSIRFILNNVITTRWPEKDLSRCWYLNMSLLWVIYAWRRLS